MKINQGLLLGTGEVTATGVRPQAAGGTEAEWTLTWPLQQAAGIAPVTLRAHYGTTFHHPHLRSGTTGDWPLNVFDEAQAAAELPTLRAMAAADLHNLVFQLGGDVRIIPAVQTSPPPEPAALRQGAERIFAEVTIGRHVLEVAPISPFCPRCVGAWGLPVGTIADRDGSLCCGVTGLPGCRCKDQRETGRGDPVRAARKNSDPAGCSYWCSGYCIAEARERLER